MDRTLVALTTGAVFAFSIVFSVHPASAGERCVCTSSMAVPPVPPVAPLPPLPPPPPLPPEGARHVQTKVIVIGPDGLHHVSHIRRIVRVEEHSDDEDRMTRDEFIKRAERAFDEHDRNHDGILDENEREGMADADDSDSAEIDVPEPPEPPDADEAPEPPRAPHAPHRSHD